MSVSDSIQCAHCNCIIEDPESGGSYWHDDFAADVCWECYHDHVHKCLICGDEELMPSQRSEFILVKNELAGPRRPPGVFRVLSQPYLGTPLIGSSILCLSEVCWIDRLPKRDYEYDQSGHICLDCAKPYAAIWRKHFQFKPAHRPHSWWFDRYWHLEMRHTRKKLRQHPDILRDLEVPAFWNAETGYRDYKLRQLEQVYRLRIRSRTWHEWLVFEYKGVKIYGCYSPSSKLDSWLLLTPDPLHRKLRNASRHPEKVLLANCLPTYPKKPEGEKHTSIYYDEPICRQSIIDAIDQGLLTQAGVFNYDGTPILCR